MRTLMNNTIYVILFLALAAVAVAQPADLKAVGEKMRDRRMSYKASYNLYDAYTAGKLLESQQMEVAMWDGLSNIKTKLFHVIRNKQHYLYVDLSRKVMLLNKVNNYKEEMKQAEKMRSLIDLDSVFSENAGIKLLAEKGDERTYRCTYPPGSKHAYSDLTINYKTYTMIKAVMYYNHSLTDMLGRHNELSSARKPRIEMVFQQFAYSTKLNPQTFALNQYVARTGATYKPQPVYTGYQFIDNTQTR